MASNNDDSNPRMQRNLYMEEVLQQQEQVVNQLKRKAPVMQQNMVQERVEARIAGPTTALSLGGGDGAPPAPSAPAIDIRITGFWRFKTVIVPPNVYVIHTRRGHAEPLHIGLGISFRYDPETDAFLVIPAVMQTIVINARCICRQRQGILVQAYVQWIIDDVKTAYQKLDFSDPIDPMQVVNIQLREQAEAAIKDKVATLDIDDILADKQPIIEELTHRLREVAEGKGQGKDGQAEGLGLKIVTVQIKEAVVSSTALWQNLQAPFRAEQARIAELSRLANETEIESRRLAQRKASELAELSVEQEIEAQRHQQQTQSFDLQHTEKVRQFQLEQQATAERARAEATTKAIQEEQELGLEQTRAEQRLKKMALKERELEAQKALDDAEAERQLRQQEQLLKLRIAAAEAEAVVEKAKLEVLKEKRALDNDISAARLQQQLIENLPVLASKMPAPQKVEQIIVSDQATSQLSGLAAFLKSAWVLVNGKQES